MYLMYVIISKFKDLDERIDIVTARAAGSGHEPRSFKGAVGTGSRRHFMILMKYDPDIT